MFQTRRSADSSSFPKWLTAGAALAASLAPLHSANGQNNDDSSAVDGVNGQVQVSPFLTVDLHVQDTELGKVLQMLSIQSQKNIIASKSVSGTVNADLYDVTFYEALSSILNANGYGYREKGNFIYVYTFEELKAIEDAERKMVHRVFHLNYLNSADASVFLQPFLSEKGSIAINGETEPGFQPDITDGGADSFAFSATLVVTDYEENVKEIEGVLQELDTRPRQVMVDATVLQTVLTEDNAWGVDFSLLGDLDFSDLTAPGTPVDSLITGSGTGGFQPSDNTAQAGQTSVGRTGEAGGLKIGVVSNDISVFLRVLDETTDTTVVSRPKVLALNRNRGEILVGRKIGYLSTTSTETSTTQTVEFLDTGTQLIFRPFVSNDGFIRMELKPSVSEGIIRTVTGNNGDPVTIPDEITQELTTNVVVRDGETIILGGLFKEETSLGRRQVPLLGDIPLIGAAFKGQDDSSERSEIMFLITPTILEDEYAFASGANAADMVEDTRMAARNGVLWWSRDKMTSQHNLRAQEAMANGDTQMALYEVNQSLRLNPTQPMVLKMRDQLTGESTKWFNTSILEAAFKNAPASAFASEPQADNTPAESGSTPVVAGVPVTELPVEEAADAIQEFGIETVDSSEGTVDFTSSDTQEQSPSSEPITESEFSDPAAESGENATSEPIWSDEDDEIAPISEPAAAPEQEPAPVGPESGESSSSEEDPGKLVSTWRRFQHWIGIEVAKG